MLGRRVMKKFYIFIFIIIFSSLILVSCMDNTYNLALNNISEIRENILVYKDDDIYVSFMSGTRESDYRLDGVSTTKTNFAVVNLEILNEIFDFNSKNVSYSMIINDIKYEDKMLNNPYDNSFVADLKINATSIDHCEISFKIDDITKTVILSTITENWDIKAKDGLRIVCTDLKDYLKQHIYDNALNAEIFIKVVYNDKYSEGYFWYIQLVTTNGNVYTEIINPLNGEIVARNLS